MNTLCGIVGRREPAVVRAMAAAMSTRAEAANIVEGPNFVVASAAPIDAGAPCAIDGEIRNTKREIMSPADFVKMAGCVKSPGALKIRGMYAAVAKINDSWWLLRDRLGVKPLYYYEGPDFLLFASELKGILASGLIEKHISLTSVDLYLTFRCIPGPESIIQGVRRVRPGNVAIYANGKVSETAFSGFKLETTPTTRAAAADRLHDMLSQTLERAPSPNMLWSAGIDTAAIAALGHRHNAVFIALKSSWQNETRRAKELAKTLDVKLQVIKADRFEENMLARLAYHLDEPIADASALPLWMIAEQAAAVDKQFVTGYGADELLGGQTRYMFLQRARGAQKLVPVNFLTDIAPALPPNVFVRRANKYLTSIRDSVEAYQSLVAVFDQGDREGLYTRAMKAAIYEKGGSTAVMRPHFTHEALTQDLLSLDLNIGLPALLLPQCDRIMAAHGVELQFPYLDDDIVDFVIGLPAKVKFGVLSKPLLRQAVKGVVPPWVRLRARRGFRVPQSGPSVRVIDNFAQEVITRDRVEASGLFRWPFVSDVLATYTHNVYRRRQFWALLMLFAWFREVMEK
jgi:asparagine synthase (glutamine-hydrolysing)